MVVCILLLGLAGQVPAEDRNWDMTSFETGGSWFNPSVWVEGSVPVNGQSVAINKCCAQNDVDIDNGGAGVSLPASAIRFDNKTNLLDLSGADDAFIAASIAFNGAGGGEVDVHVPVTANTFTSNRHGAHFHAPFTVNTILANSGHQDKWEINVSPTGTITYIDLDENRGPDGDTIDGYFAFNADTTVTTMDHTWSNLRVGAGATLTVGALTYWSYLYEGSPHNVNPITLNGDMNVTTFNVFDMETSTVFTLDPGTYGRIGLSEVDNEVEWITSGDGVITVIPEPSAFALAAIGLLSLLVGRRRRFAIWVFDGRLTMATCPLVSTSYARR